MVSQYKQNFTGKDGADLQAPDCGVPGCCLWIGHLENANHKNTMRFTPGISIRRQRRGEKPAFSNTLEQAKRKRARKTRATIKTMNSGMPNLKSVMRASCSGARGL